MSVVNATMAARLENAFGPGRQSASRCVTWDWGLDLLRADMGAIADRFSPAIWADPDVLPYAAGVSVWGRWFIWVVSAIEIAYRPGFWYPGTGSSCSCWSRWQRSTAWSTTGS